MNEFNLEVYKGSSQYICFFDVYIKNQLINKEAFLIDEGITPSSYRRAKDNEQNIGKKIVAKLATRFNLNVPPVELITELEAFLNRVYYNMDYKILDTYDEDMKYIEDVESKNYIVFPVVKLIKLLLGINAPTYTTDTIEKYQPLYEEVKQYKVFYTAELLKIYELFEISFEDKLLAKAKFKQYDNDMAYFILASKCHSKKQYVESLYFANKSKTISFERGNFKRYFYLNYIVMNSLIKVESYDECFDIAYRQKFSLESLNIKGYELTIANNYIVLSLVGLEKYERVLNLLSNKTNYNVTELTCYLISLYMTNKNNYVEYFEKKLDLNSFPAEAREFFTLLNKYLVHSQKRVLNTLEYNNLSFPFIKNLK